MGDVVLKSIAKRYGQLQILEAIDVTIATGEFIVIVGPSGCGKSTLLRMIAGLEDISEGEILINGQDVSHHPPSKRGFAMVFQSYALYPHMSVRENMGFSLKTAGVPRTEIDEKTMQAAQILKLEPFLERRPKDLSGGQRQRVAIGRAIVRDPTAFLFDEPLSNLDAALRVEMRLELAKLHKDLGKTMIYVTHDQVEAMTLADRIIVLNRGGVAQIGTPRTLYEHPKNLFVAQFIGSPKMNALACGPENAQGNTLLKKYFKGKKAVKIGVRPEHVAVCEKGAGDFDGRVDVVEYLGSDSFIVLDLGAAESLMIRSSGTTSFEPGTSVGLRFDPENLHFFDDQGRVISTEKKRP